MGRGATPAREYEKGISPELAIEPREEQVPLEYAATPLLKDTLLRVLSMLETMGQTGSPTSILDTSQTRVRVQLLDQ